jgi:hypothetical protein
MRESFANPVAVYSPVHGSFDRIAELMGVPSTTFLDTYQDNVQHMKLSFLKYVKALQSKQRHPALPFGIGNDPDEPKVVLESTGGGYPILPIPLPSQNWKKKDWEDLFTMYMGRHYRKVRQSIMD